MSSGVKCRNCGSTDIEEDNARGDRGKICKNICFFKSRNKNLFRISLHQLWFGTGGFPYCI